MNITKKCNPKKLDINPAKEGAREKNNKSVLTPLALIGLFAAPAGAVPMGQSDHALLNPITGGGYRGLLWRWRTASESAASETGLCRGLRSAADRGVGPLVNSEDKNRRIMGSDTLEVRPHIFASYSEGTPRVDLGR